VRVQPPPGCPLGAEATCAIQAHAAYGPQDALVWVDQHGFALPDGRSEAAVVRIGCGSAPAWFSAATDGYATLVRAAPGLPDGAAQVRAFRAWLDELPGAPTAERRCTTLRYVATALFALAEVDPAARSFFERICRALEEAGSFVIPLETACLSDARRYELIVRPGAGAPRVVRPGFQGQGQVVQQRARVLADPSWLGTMTS
jgi:hypothetical protein